MPEGIAQRTLRRAASEAQRAATALPAVARQSKQVLDSLPESVRSEVQQSVHRLAAVRTPKDVLQVLEAEVSRLSQVIVPVFAAHPLPIHTRGRATMVVAVGAGLAAGFAEIDELAIIVTDGLAAPSAVAAGSVLLLAFVAEVWVAVSLRVHQIARDDRTVDPVLLADEVTAAVLGTDVVFVRQLAGRAARSMARRLTRRWAAALVPGAGVAVDAWAASRTVKAIIRLPLDGHPAGGRPGLVGLPGVPAVDEQRLARDEAGVVGAEE
jgi:hypothetical protein